MTGMWNFKFSLCYLSLATLVVGAEVSFLSDSKITGEVLTMDQQGIVTMSTPYTDQVLKVKVDKIQKIDFGKSGHPFEVPIQNLTLINGDSFPVEVRSLDDKILQISSPVIGNIAIPREFIDSLEIGVFSPKIIYSGPNNINEWKNSRDEVSGWEIEDGRLIAEANSPIYRDMKLPENYSIRFKLTWDSDPNFRFTFGDPMDLSGRSVNRYILEFRRAGLEIKRESTGNNRYPPIASSPRQPDDFPNKEVWIEVRVNRNGGRLDFYLNDKLEGRYADTHPNIPKGTGVTFFARPSNENTVSISEIEVSEWDNRAEKHRSEDRGDGKTDALIGRNGERFGGHLTSIIDGENSKVYRFKSKFDADPTEFIELHESEVSNIFFATADDPKSEKFEGLSLFFRNQGNIQVSKCIFDENLLHITHPLLGELEINRLTVSRLERSSDTKFKPSKGK